MEKSVSTNDTHNYSRCYSGRNGIQMTKSLATVDDRPYGTHRTYRTHVYTYGGIVLEHPLDVYPKTPKDVSRKETMEGVRRGVFKVDEVDVISD